MAMMEQQQIHGSVCADRLPSLSAKYPWLVVQNAFNNFSNQVFYNLHNPLSQYCCQIPELAGRRIRGFFHGWVILSNNVMWSLWNPSTSKVTCLPPLILKDGDSDDDIIGLCCLTSPPDDPGSTILLTRTDKSTFVFCRLDRKRKKLKWTEMSYAKQLKRITGDGRLLHSLTFCDGKVYALNTDGCLFRAIIIIDIVVKDKEVVIELLLFGPTPLPPEDPTYGRIVEIFLAGSSTVLFCVVVGFIEETHETINYVNLFKLDTTTIKWEDIHSIVNEQWDVTDMYVIDNTNWDKLMMTDVMWEEMLDLKAAIFFVDLALEYSSVFYLPSIDSELGGYIHIRSKMGTIIQSYHIKDKTLGQSYMPSPLLSTSHVTLWEEKRLKGDYKQEEEDIKGDEIMMMRSVTDDEFEFNESHLLNLPIHFLEMIMENCAGVEYMKLRATCKRCHLAATLIRWRDKSGLKRLQNHSLVSPWLMVVDNEQGIITYTDPLLGDKYFMKNIPVSIYGKKVFCSKFGWLLLFLTKSTLVFYNPFTSDVRKLPCIEYSIADSFSFSAPPTSPDCMVVVFSGYVDWEVHLHFVGGEFSWRKLRLRLLFDGVYTYDDFLFPTFYGRDLYALNKDELHIFKDLGIDDYSWEKDVAQAPPKSCCAKYYLTKLDDQHLILLNVSEESVEVFKLNDSTKTWEKVDGLGRHMIYISEETCLCVEAKTPEMGNKIYFPELHSRNNGRIVFYSLETCTYGTFNNKTIQVSHTVVRQLHHPCTWIEPCWS